MSDLPEVMSKEEEIEYCRKIKDGDEKARQEFIEKNMRLVGWMLGKNKFSNMEYEDKFSYACEGLIKAADIFDSDKGKFSTIAAECMKNELIKGYYSQQRSRSGVPKNKQKEISELEKLQRQFKIEGEGMVATPTDLSNITNIPEDRIIELLKIRNTLLNQESYEQIKENEGITSDKIVDNALDGDAIQETESGYVLDGVYVEPEEIPSYEEKFVGGLSNDGNLGVTKQIEKDIFRSELDKVIETLTKREAEVIRQRNGLEDGKQNTLEEVAWMHNVSRERIRQIESKALRKLRHPSRSKRIIDFLNDNDTEISEGLRTEPLIRYSRRPVTAKELYDPMTPVDNSVNITSATEILRHNSNEKPNTYRVIRAQMDETSAEEEKPIKIEDSDTDKLIYMNEDEDSFEDLFQDADGEQNIENEIENYESTENESTEGETVEYEIDAIREEYSQYEKKDAELSKKLSICKSLLNQIIAAKEPIQTKLARIERLINDEDAKFLRADFGMKTVYESMRNQALKDLERQNSEEKTAKEKYEKTEEQKRLNDERKAEIGKKVEQYIDSL